MSDWDFILQLFVGFGIVTLGLVVLACIIGALGSTLIILIEIALELTRWIIKRALRR